MGNQLYRNLPNIASILGVIPLGLLLLPQGYKFLIPLIIYNNFMDDLDGVLAVRLNLKSQFGAILDNVCDVVSHTLVVLFLGMHFGGPCALASVAAAAGIILRISSRLNAPPVTPRGSATNELIRHILFILVLAQQFEFNVAIGLTLLFVLHGISMLAPFEMPHLIRSKVSSVAAIAAINLVLLIAWLVPVTAVPIAACFGLTYLYSFVTRGFGWLDSPKQASPQST